MVMKGRCTEEDDEYSSRGKKNYWLIKKLTTNTLFLQSTASYSIANVVTFDYMMNLTLVFKQMTRLFIGLRQRKVQTAVNSCV